jgi:CheY-like chemotaxis protein
MVRSTHAPSVMLVDDDLRSRYVLAALLRGEGCAVHSASGHESWLSLFKSCLSAPATWVSLVAALDPGAIIIDWQMLGGMALHVLGELRRNPLTQHIPVAVLTAPGAMHDAEVARSMGASCSLARPLSRDGLRPLVEQLFQPSAATKPVLVGDDRPEMFPS